MTLDPKQKKFLIIGAGLVVLYLLGEQKHKKIERECKMLVPSKFGFKYGFWSPKFFDLTPKLFRKVVSMKEWRKSYEKNPVFILATINDDRLVTPNGIFTKENGRFYNQPSNDFLTKKNKAEISKSTFEKEINSYNELRAKTEDELNNCKPISNAGAFSPDMKMRVPTEQHK